MMEAMDKPLHDAAERGDAAETQRLLQAGADFNAANNYSKVIPQEAVAQLVRAPNS